MEILTTFFLHPQCVLTVGLSDEASVAVSPELLVPSGGLVVDTNVGISMSRMLERRARTPRRV